MLKWEFQWRRCVSGVAGLFVLAGIMLGVGLCAPLAAKADTIGTSSFALPGGGSTYNLTATYSYYIGGSSAPVDCNALSTMNAWVPTDVQLPNGAVWEYWQAEEIANPQETTITPYGDPYVSGGTHVAWGSLFARSLSTGAVFYWSGTAWTSATGYQPFLHPGGNSYAIHDWVYFGMSNGANTQWVDLGFRNSGAYQGAAHVVGTSHCFYP